MCDILQRQDCFAFNLKKHIFVTVYLTSTFHMIIYAHCTNYYRLFSLKSGKNVKHALNDFFGRLEHSEYIKDFKFYFSNGTMKVDLINHKKFPVSNSSIPYVM